MDCYPTKFSPEARAAVEAELIRAGRLHDQRKQEWNSDGPFPLRRSLQKNILSVFLVWAREAIELGKKGVWTVDDVRAQALEGLRLITLEIGFKRSYESFIERGGWSITREAQREFEATAEWRRFEDDLLELAAPLPKPAGKDESLQAGLPDLSEATKRKLDLKWTDLLDKYHLSGEHLSWHKRARLRRDDLRQIAQIGIIPSINVVEHRFTDLAYAFWSIWNPSIRHEVFVGWLDEIRRWTSADIEGVWKGSSESIDVWYKKTCAPAVEKELDARVREWTKRARAAELAYLEHNSKAAATPTFPIEKPAPVTVGANVSAPDPPESSTPEKPKLNLERIRKFIDDEGYKNDDLAGELGISPRAVSSLRNDGEYHGSDALTRLANLMKCDVDDLFLP